MRFLYGFLTNDSFFFWFQSSKQTALYILDCLFSVFVVHTLVVFVWRGAWCIIDIYLYPKDYLLSAWGSLVRISQTCPPCPALPCQFPRLDFRLLKSPSQTKRGKIRFRAEQGAKHLPKHDICQPQGVPLSLILRKVMKS